MKTALYSGSFDPFTYGHKDIAMQALCVFDKIYIAIGENSKKKRTTDTLEAMHVIASYFPQEYIGRKVEITTFTGALTEFAKELKVTSIVRGLRQISDFNDEFVLNGVVNMSGRQLMTYFICDPMYLHVSSSTAREMHSLGMKTDWLINHKAKASLK